QDLARTWSIFTDVTLHPTFAPADFEQTRSRLITGLQQAQADADSALQELSDRTIYAGHPYANDPQGTVANMSAFTSDDVKNYYHDLMQKSRLLLVVVGDIDADKLKTLVAGSFGVLP